MSTPDRPATISARAGVEYDTQHGAVIPPIHLTSTFAFAGFGERRGYDYTRSGNPTRDLLSEALSQLEGAAGGVVTASGMAAVTVALALLEPGGTLVVQRDCYGGTHRLFIALARRNHFRLVLLEPGDLAGASAALECERSLLWIETPSNPLLNITDLAAWTGAAKARGALVCVDNTFLSPALQNPLAFGADLVVHSTTKYLNGHSDVVGGAVLAATKPHADALGWWANCLGVTGAPFDAYLTLRGLRTLHARMPIHEENAGTIARFLAEHPAVERVYYPGLASHPGHEIARRQQRGFGGMLSFELGGGDGAIPVFLGKLRRFSLAESLGGVESLIAHPATMTHAAMDAEARAAAGIGASLLRLSVGIEDVRDLISDLEAGLAASATRTWSAFQNEAVAPMSCEEPDAKEGRRSVLAEKYGEEARRRQAAPQPTEGRRHSETRS